MQPATENKIVLVTRRTRLEELIQRFNTEDQARFYIEHLGADFSDYQCEHATYQRALAETRETLGRLGRLQLVDRSFVPNFIFGPRDTIVALGQDGLVANVLKYLDAQPVVGVNPDPRRFEGVLLPFKPDDLSAVMPEVFRGARPLREVTMAKALLNTGQALYGVNDLFIGVKTHASARYRIEVEGHGENQSSSGIIVSTGLGSTGWLRSIVAGAAGVINSLAGNKKYNVTGQKVPWNADYLYFSVREPWPSRTSASGIIFGKITEGKPLTLVSQMPEHGVIFSDGIEADFIEFNAGTTAVVSLAEKKGRLVA